MEASTTSTPGSGITYVQAEPGCPYCGRYHEGACPRVEELEYYPDGTLKRVKLRQEPAQPVVMSLCPPPVRQETGHTCGKDCDLPTW